LRTVSLTLRIMALALKDVVLVLRTESLALILRIMALALKDVALASWS